jgi:L-glutamine:scyllo-inosose aminotransferase/L-glutamine:2-deoxy-scyllo-inosose/3-amino-2,3-dideoxy-scyllo-inosose aminotransferase
MNPNSTKRLAIMGGEAVRSTSFPKWPRPAAGAEAALLDVLHSGRWAVSGMYNGTLLYERRFSKAFADYHAVDFCTPIANGSAALTVALQALGVGYGDEVLVPGITWVACASAVLRVGAVPILVDVDEETLCMSLASARAGMTERTKAILVVHLYCSMVDLDGFLELSRETGIPILEDCSQAHGAIWNGRKAGTFGKIGAFSMQDTKVLSCGEGGATITNDPALHDRMQQLRSDGRRFRARGTMNRCELEEVGGVLGSNLCMSEFHAALLLHQLAELDRENRLRRENAAYLNELLAEVGAVRQIPAPPRATEVTYYQYCGAVDLKAFGNIAIERFCGALSEELQIHVEPIDCPLNGNVLYDPEASARFSREAEFRRRIDPKQFPLPNAVRAAKRHFTIPHRTLLGTRSDVESIAEAIHKVQAQHHLL